MFWTEMWRALAHAIRANHGFAEPNARPQRFLADLEANGFTIMPLEVRRAADLFGTVAVAKTTDGYAVIDPKKWHLVVDE